MKTVTLRTLLREPLRVKRLTRAGNAVLVTDKGKPLWTLQPAATHLDEERRRAKIEAELAAVLRGPKSTIPLSKIVRDSRR